MKDNVVYNKHDNRVMVKTDGDLIYINYRRFFIKKTLSEGQQI